jgi:hypothetical protein
MAIGYDLRKVVFKPVKTYVSETDKSLIKHTSWGAIFAGAFTSVVILASLSLLGVAIGALTPSMLISPLGNMTAGVYLWLGISAILAFYGGGWVSGRLCGSLTPLIGSLHGVVVWGLVTVLSLSMLNNPLSILYAGINGIVMKGLMDTVGSAVVSTGNAALITNAAIAGFIGMVLNFISAFSGGRVGILTAISSYEHEKAEIAEEKRDIPKVA